MTKLNNNKKVWRVLPESTAKEKSYTDHIRKNLQSTEELDNTTDTYLTKILRQFIAIFVSFLQQDLDNNTVYKDMTKNSNSPLKMIINKL